MIFACGRVVGQAMSSRRLTILWPYCQNIAGAYLEPRQGDKCRNINRLTFLVGKRETPKFTINVACRCRVERTARFNTSIQHALLENKARFLWGL